MKKIAFLLTIVTSLVYGDGASLYSKCVSCHGAKGEKAALGKSKIINTMSKDEIVLALQGYKAGTYGGASKALMKAQMSSFNDSQIKEIASYIISKK